MLLAYRARGLAIRKRFIDFLNGSILRIPRYITFTLRSFDSFFVWSYYQASSLESAVQNTDPTLNRGLTCNSRIRNLEAQNMIHPRAQVTQAF